MGGKRVTVFLVLYQFADIFSMLVATLFLHLVLGAFYVVHWMPLHFTCGACDLVYGCSGVAGPSTDALTLAVVELGGAVAINVLIVH